MLPEPTLWLSFISQESCLYIWRPFCAVSQSPARGHDQEMCFEGAPLIWNTVPMQRARRQPAACSTARLPGSSPCPALSGRTCPPSPSLGGATRNAVCHQVGTPVAFGVLAATENHLPDVPSPHLGCLGRWHCLCSSSLCNLDTKFFDIGMFSVKDCSSANISKTLMA